MYGKRLEPRHKYPQAVGSELRQYFNEYCVGVINIKSLERRHHRQKMPDRRVTAMESKVFKVAKGSVDHLNEIYVRYVVVFRKLQHQRLEGR